MNNLDTLNILQAKRDALAERLKHVSTDSVEFKNGAPALAAINRDIDAIMQQIDQHNKHTARMLNAAMEHVVGEFINPSISFAI